MGKRKGKSRRGGKQAPWRKILPWAIAGVLLVAGVLFALLYKNEALVRIERAVSIDEQSLLVFGNSGDDTDTTRWSSVGILGPDGVIRHRAHEKGALRFLGMTDEVVWFSHPTRDIHARRLPSLELVPGLAEAIANHGPLSNRHNVAGFTREAIVLVGADNKHYALALDGSISRADELKYALPGAVLRGSADAPGVGEELRQLQQKVGKDPELSHPVVVTDAAGTAPLSLDEPGYLVRSIVFYKGGQSQAVHRFAPDGTLVWSTSVEDMMDAVEADGQHIGLVWVGRLDGRLCAIVQLSEFFSGDESSDDYSTHVQRLVDIDPATGALSNTRPITAEKT